jgi:hypothetical protein
MAATMHLHSCRASRAGMLPWDTSPGIPAAEVWTRQTTDDPCQLLDPRSSLSVRHAYTLLTRSRRTARLQAHRRFVVQALRHSAATREQMDAAVTTFIGCFGRLLRVPWENGYKEVFWRLAVNGVRAAGACQRFFSALCPYGVVGSGAHGDCERLRQHAFLEFAIAQAVRTEVQRGLGGALFQQWHLWLVDPPPSVCEIVWRVVVLLSGQWSRVGNTCGPWFICLLGRGLLCSRPFLKLPPPGLPCMILPGMIGQSQLRAGMKLALIILSCLFASRFFSPVHRGCASPISTGGVPFPCFAWQALCSTGT